MAGRGVLSDTEPGSGGRRGASLPVVDKVLAVGAVVVLAFGALLILAVTAKSCAALALSGHCYGGARHGDECHYQAECWAGRCDPDQSP